MDGALHVLVVDDDADTALFVRTVLERGGMTVTTCADPLEALTLIGRVEFDAAITDIEMPGMTGLEFLDRLRQVRPDLPVTVMTAHASVDYAVDALRRQADDFLVKPVPKDTLAATIRRQAETAAARRAAARQRQTVLAVGAHPDDVEIGVGGTLAAHRSAGDQVVILTLSRGARGGDTAARVDESLAAAELIGARLFLEDLEDTRISPADPTMSIIERVVAEVRPTIVYTHSANDRHQDHRAVHQAASVATRSVPTVACFQSPSATIDFRPTRFVDIDGFTRTKLELLARFRSQAGIRAYLEDDFVLATARYWSRYGSSGRFVEPLEVLRDGGGVVGAVSGSAFRPATSTEPFGI
ncbi:response regulator [Blastococcus sp. TBT05-19]|uniref:response regulator n=1 Tax=Blastococcus sp. TBT05-19 TaxID=2250581 RepID=UPI0018F695FB|nr:response regulator [Blastococcus sp. TBT05-19]